MRRLGLLAAAAVLALSFPAEAEDQKVERVPFSSGGKAVGMTVFRAPARQAPAILVVHGAGGVDAGNQYISQLAAAVAASGYATFVVEYFDRTGTAYASDSAIQKHFDTWVETLEDAVSFIAKQPEIDAQRIGTFGYSLGGYLVVAHAARDPRVRATVELAGGIDPDYARNVRRLPPLLIVHGRQDQRVPFARGLELEKFVRGLGVPVETEFLADERHLLSPLSAIRALGRALEFFGKNLK